MLLCKGKILFWAEIYVLLSHIEMLSIIDLERCSVTLNNMDVSLIIEIVTDKECVSLSCQNNLKTS